LLVQQFISGSAERTKMDFSGSPRNDGPHRQGHVDENYDAGGAGILGSEEFVDASIHRIWE
jgi:hypothetical protein